MYTDWPSAQAQITGWTKPKHKSFATRSEAEAFVKAGKSDGRAISSVTITMAQPESEDVKSNSQKSSKGESTPPTKKLKKNGDTSVPTAQAFEDGENITYAPGEAPLPADAEDGFDSHVFLNPETGKLENKSEKMLNATKMMPKKDSPTGMLNIYTDGSSLGNGQLGSSAGVGVFFGPGDTRYTTLHTFSDQPLPIYVPQNLTPAIRNVSAPLVGPRQTNQRAELTAIQKALDLAPLDRSVTIFSDSNYAINCATTWSKTWRKNGWVTSAKKPVENKDIVELIVERIDTRDACGVTTEFKWLKGHANDPGNVAADALAVNGAREARNRARSEASTSALPAADYDEEYEA